jgi:hypothetical protein
LVNAGAGCGKKYEYDYQRIYLSLSTQFQTTKPTRKPQLLTLSLTSWSLWDDRYLLPAELDAIIDGQRKSFGILKPVSRRVINGKYVVNLMRFMSGDEFQLLAGAQKVEMRLGEVEFTFDDHVLKMLSEYSKRIQP